ncbi:uncharacterized protein A4U43_C01F4840 [Asparagus officinalis]|uniref:Enhancer of mRNA-decapping protein 4 WD40 repeat region domain-containing protein n=1 Tax=Asparagus officinalis TaxID=4686 RepID=A0A5P1FPD2_ASPOF|nr:enhancer of mRNA-decapping protein 4-like isoform X2 [Asparagus officinalis]ONK79287.1 uncharacterized protein A4U43_C01F4840 [Asparagus officinalis]
MQKLFKPLPSNPIPNNLNSPNPNPNFYSPPPSGPYSYPHQTPPFNPHHFMQHPQSPLTPNPNPNSTHGARLMALLGSTPVSHIEWPHPRLPPAAAAAVATSEFRQFRRRRLGPAGRHGRVASSKMPRGRLLGTGDRAVLDVDSRFMGESKPPQLEVTPITKYVSDPGLVLGRQIAVNRTYICYGLKLGPIRILNINTALRSLLRGHSQKVTDMAFFAEDVHLLASASVDGKVIVWKINEGPDEENKPQITGKIIVAVQIGGDGEPYHPRICWHSHKQEVLIVAIGSSVLKIDTTRVGRGKEFSADEPLRCPAEKPIDGIQFIGKHEEDVTDLSISQWMTTRLASASKDGTVKIWDDRKTVPLVTLRPHDGQPVSSVAFLTSPHRPDHIVLITAGPLNREVKIWTSTSDEGWLLPSDSEAWQCIQTLELRSSAEPRHEEAFFNQLVALPRASLILLANAKKNAIYAIHVDYGPFPASTRMGCIADFTVTMPILSLTGTSDSLPDGEEVVQVYCVQTQAIQQYALDLYQCLPPPGDAFLGRDPGSHMLDSPISEGFPVSQLSRGPSGGAYPVGSASPRTSLPGSSSESLPTSIFPVTSVSYDVSAIHERTTSNVEVKPSAPPLSSSDPATVNIVPSPALNMDLSGGLSILRNPSKGFDQGPSRSNSDVSQPVDYPLEGRVDVVVSTASNVPSAVNNSGRDEPKAGINNINLVPNPHLLFKLGGNTTHLVTPSEILSGAISSSENTRPSPGLRSEEVKVQDIVDNNDAKSVNMEVKHVDESRFSHDDQSDSQKEPPIDKDKCLNTSPSKVNSESPTTETCNVGEAPKGDSTFVADTLGQTLVAGEEEVQGNADFLETTEAVSALAKSTLATKEKAQKAKQPQASGPLSHSLSPSNSTESLNEPGSNASLLSTDTTSSQLHSMKEMLNQFMSMQKEMQKQMSSVVAGPVNKEGKRVENALGRNMEKAMKANMDALWTRFQEETSKNEKAARERAQQLTSLITNCTNKDLPSMLERTLKKELSSAGQALARAVTPAIEKSISSSVADSFQRGVADKAVVQLEKSINSKLEATVSRQIQAQFQTSGKHALQEALRSGLESSMIPAFEQSCKAMFEQVDMVFQKGMNEHTAAAQQKFESTHTPLAITLRDAINSASSVTHNLTSELADGQRKILSLVAGSTNGLNPMAVQQSNGSVTGLPAMRPLSLQQIEAPLDPTKELSRLISECKFGEAFTMALHRSDVSIVSWLCSKVDLHSICTMVPLPLNQGVLLALLQQLACDISKEMTRKLGWMTDVAVAINPTDPMIAPHVRPIFEQVYNILAHQRSLPTITASEASSIRLIMHVINSVLMSCK